MNDSASRPLDRYFSGSYDKLKEIARRTRLGQLDCGHDTCSLVHEAYIRLSENRGITVESELHFFRVAARAMRYVLVDRARRKLATKRGGGRSALQLDEIDATEVAGESMIDLDSALTRLQEIDARKARIVELRFFGGYSVAQTASLLRLSPSTVHKEWEHTKAWIAQELM